MASRLEMKKLDFQWSRSIAEVLGGLNALQICQIFCISEPIKVHQELLNRFMMVSSVLCQQMVQSVHSRHFHSRFLVLPQGSEQVDLCELCGRHSWPVQNRFYSFREKKIAALSQLSGLPQEFYSHAKNIWAWDVADNLFTS